ncbi:MAG: hypothetical protein IKF38_06655 [Clostridia bacterium]|nr:hypothetical protein [Clostridia bacterium]
MRKSKKKTKKEISIITLILIIAATIVIMAFIIGKTKENNTQNNVQGSTSNGKVTNSQEQGSKEGQELSNEQPKDEFIILGNAIEGIGGSGNEDDWKIIGYNQENKTIYAMLADYLPNTTGVAEKAGLTTGEGVNKKYGVKGASQADLIARLMPDEAETDNNEIKSTKANVKDQAQKAWKSLLFDKLQNNKAIKVYGGLDKTTLDKATGGAYQTANSVNDTDAHMCFGYWLASIDPENEGGVYIVDYTSYIGSDGSYNTNYGICPVAVISEEINVQKNNNGIWEIK